jgi:hypothetical protein
MRSPLIATFVLAVSSPLFLLAADPDPELADAEKCLQDEQVQSDGPALVKFFQARTATEQDNIRLQLAVRLLGNESYEVREDATATLRSAGRKAKPFLLEGLKNPDLEIVHRVEGCLARLEEHREVRLVSSAARVLGQRNPKGAAEAILAYLPSAADEAAEDALFAALGRVAVTAEGVHPALLACLSDREPSRRSAAAFVIAAVQEHRPGVVKLLEDPDLSVRYRAAVALIRVGEKKAVDALIPLLTEASFQAAQQAEDVLFRLASEKLPTTTLSDSSVDARRKARTAWESWWKDNQDKVDLKKLSLDDAILGFTVIAEYSDAGVGGRGRVWECGPDGKQRWEITDVASPMDVQCLPGGRFLIAEAGRGVTERDKTGKVLWEVKVSAPVSCQRLPSGNTFVGTYNDLFEYDRTGKQIFHHRHTDSPSYYAHKMRNGNYVYMVSTGQITEIDGSGKQVKTFKPETPDVSGCGYWHSVEDLPNGNFLVSLGSTGRVVEVDDTGKVVWSCKTDQTTGAMRLRSGNALCVGTEARSVVEYDRDGKEVWRVKTVGRPFRARRY